jgi:YD repeat-containing protein
MGRTTRVDLPDGSYSTYAYLGNTTTITDPAGKWKKYTVDAMGRLVQVSEPEGHETYYTYNVLGRLTQVSMPRGGVTQTRTFNYDLGTGRLMSAANPETGTVSFGYNADGSLAWKRDAKGQQIDYIYDSYGRLRQYAGITLYHDSNPFDAGFSTNRWGRLVAAQWSGPFGTLTEMYGYTVGGRMSARRLRLDRGGEQFDLEGSFGWDTEGPAEPGHVPGVI